MQISHLDLGAKQAAKQTHDAPVHYLCVPSFPEVLEALSDLEAPLLQHAQGSRCRLGSQEVPEVPVFQVNPRRRSLASASWQPAGPAVL